MWLSFNSLTFVIGLQFNVTGLWWIKSKGTCERSCLSWISGDENVWMGITGVTTLLVVGKIKCVQPHQVLRLVGVQEVAIITNPFLMPPPQSHLLITILIHSWGVASRNALPGQQTERTAQGWRSHHSGCVLHATNYSSILVSPQYKCRKHSLIDISGGFS